MVHFVSVSASERVYPCPFALTLMMCDGVRGGKRKRKGGRGGHLVLLGRSNWRLSHI